MNKKTMILSNICSFIIGSLIFGTIGAYAATTLASSSVSYDNSTSGTTSTTVQGAVDELYNNAAAGKINIINSLNNKGLSLTNNSNYSQIVSGIDSLSLKNYEYYNKYSFDFGTGQAGTGGTKDYDISLPIGRYLVFIATTWGYNYGDEDGKYTVTVSGGTKEDILSEVNKLTPGYGGRVIATNVEMTASGYIRLHTQSQTGITHRVVIMKSTS